MKIQHCLQVPPSPNLLSIGKIYRGLQVNLRRKSAHAHTFGGDFELKIPRIFVANL